MLFPIYLQNKGFQSWFDFFPIVSNTKHYYHGILTVFYGLDNWWDLVFLFCRIPGGEEDESGAVLKIRIHI